MLTGSVDFCFGFEPPAFTHEPQKFSTAMTPLQTFYIGEESEESSHLSQSHELSV